MKHKLDNERFVFSDMNFQDFPNTTSRECTVVSKSLDLTNKKFKNGQLVSKTAGELSAEKDAELDALSNEYKKQRKTALMSFELTIFSDTTLSAEEQNDIKRVRQEWKDMTVQTDYPNSFVEPSLDSNLWSN